MSKLQIFDESGLTALTNHMKVTRDTADANASAIGDLQTDLAGLASDTQAAIEAKQDKLTFDNTPTEGSTNPVTSDGVAQVLGDISALMDEINGEVV